MYIDLVDLLVIISRFCRPYQLLIHSSNSMKDGIIITDFSLERGSEVIYYNNKDQRVETATPVYQGVIKTFLQANMTAQDFVNRVQLLVDKSALGC